jgi:hypothetical protein
LQLLHQPEDSGRFFAALSDCLPLSLEAGPAPRDLFSELLQRSELFIRSSAQVAHHLERFDSLLDGVEHVDRKLAAFFCQTADVAESRIALTEVVADTSQLAQIDAKCSRVAFQLLESPLCLPKHPAEIV